MIKGSNTGTWVGGNVSSWIAGGCNQTSDALALGSAEIMKTGTDEAEGLGKNTSVTLGVFGVSCVYGTTGEGTPLGGIKGGVAPVLSINVVRPKKEGGFLCPSSGRWTAEYILTSPHAVHFVE